MYTFSKIFTNLAGSKHRMLQSPYHHALASDWHFAVSRRLPLRPVEALQKQEQANDPQY